MMPEAQVGVLTWFKRLLSHGDYLMAERLIDKTPQDCERIYAHLMIADTYYDNGEMDKTLHHQMSAVSLWKQYSDEWWAAPILSEMIESFMKAGQTDLIQSVVSYGNTHVDLLASDWLKTHLLCGIAYGLLCLGKNIEANRYIQRAIQVGNDRDTEDERMSSLSIVRDFLAGIDSGEHYEQHILK